MMATTNILLVQHNNEKPKEVVNRLRVIFSGLNTKALTITLWHRLNSDLENELQSDFPTVKFYSSAICNSESLSRWYQKYQVGKRMVRSEQISLIHCLDIQCCQWMNWVSNHCNVPIIADIGFEFAEAHSLPLGIRLMPKLIAPSNNISNALKAFGYPCEQLAVIPSPVSLAEVKSSTTEALNLKSHFGIREDEYILINSEPLVLSSGIDSLIQALSSVRVAQPNVHLVLLGQGEERCQLEQQAMLLNMKEFVHFVKSSDDHSPYLAQADVYISGARKEGARPHILTAGQNRLPSIAPMIGSNPECIRQGITGFLALAHSHVSISEAIEMMTADPDRLSYFSEQAYFFAQRLSDPKRYGASLASVYKQEIDTHFENNDSDHLSPLLNNLGYITKLLTGSKATGGSL
ncbi:glycosyltransferase family 4 protein [Vibrio sp. S9_S30]|uniref:glycosyltransferase family 4 protein n=1 Tax=Vibrio sp. S9_S30 TaxID=2720226 RepID=UPI00168060F4|nr:glycosyltransferase family 4 protein [Vibrio sp. S9_S30]MBD1556741.1 glycosyltransferase family 4 protein [Vibrio sp. S9_S30]